MAHIISATWTVQPGKEQIVLDALTALAPESRKEPGCQVYIVHQDPDQPNVFKIFEVYDDEDALQKHGTYPHFQEHALGKAIPVLEKRERVITQTLEI